MNRRARPEFNSAEVISALDHGDPIDLQIGDARLTLEQRQPFVCLYRGVSDRVDTGTHELLFGLGSFAIAPAGGPAAKAFSKAIQEVLAHLAETFGSALLFELWSLRETATDVDQPAAPRFEICAQVGTSADGFVEALERALLAEDWLGSTPSIVERASKSPHPPGQRAVIPAGRVKALGLASVGLGISPIYRDAETGALLPEVLARTKDAFGRALKKALYAFSHSSPVHRPHHYHELGRTRLTPDIQRIDERLCRIGDAFDPLLLASPVNTASAWNAFRANHCNRAPAFNYRPLPIDTAAIKRELYAIPIEQVEDPTLHHFFASKRDELDRLVTLMVDRETDRFLLTSRQIHPAPDDALIALAEEILDHLPPHSRADRLADAIDATAFAEAARAELDRYGMTSAEVSVRDDVPGIMVSRGKLLISRHATVARRRVRATLDHEIGVHMLTYHNGGQQPLAQLRLGMAGYEELQEGLAVFAEYCTGGLSVPRWRQIAGRVVAAANLADGGDFIDTFRLLNHRRGFGQQAAFTMSMRTHRGGGLTKDVVYLRGLQLVVRHLATGGDLEPLLVGKLAYHNAHIVEELRWRGIIKAPSVVPDVFSPDRLTPVLRSLRAGLSVADMARQSVS